MLLEPDEVAEVAHFCLTPSKARSKDDIASIAVCGHGVYDLHFLLLEDRHDLYPHM